MALLGSTQHRDVEVTVAGRVIGTADKHSPGEISNGASAHKAGGNRKWRVLAGTPSVDDGSLEFTFDVDVDGWKLAHLTSAVDAAAVISITDTYRSPTLGVVISRSYTGHVSSLQEPESDASEANAQTLTVTYVADDLPSTS